MSLFGILFIIAILTAIPTFGLSFVALFFAKRWINSNEGRKVAAAAVNALGSDSTVTIPFVSAAGAQSFFKTHGSAEQKFHRVGKPAIGYIGYVKIQGDIENVVMVNNSGAFTHVTSFAPARQFGDDLLSLVAKKEFLDSILDAMGITDGFEPKEPTLSLEPSNNKASAPTQTPSSQDLTETIRTARAGDADAQYELAKLYMSGIGVRKSSRKAFEWCLRAAIQERDDEAMFDVAEMYRLGNGTKKDLAEAFKWYVSTDHWAGHPVAKNRVGIMYRDGQGVKQDPELARDWFFGAATNGNYDAMFNLGMLELSGEGGPQDFQSAMGWIMPAADAGHQRAQEYLKHLRNLYRNENGPPDDAHETFEWHVRAAKSEHEKARRLLGHP